jgi:predicted ATPase
MHLKQVTIGQEDFPTRDHYPFTLPVLLNTRTVVFNRPVTLFVGENGTGKSTLLKAICRRCNIHIWEGAYRTRFEVNRFENALPQALKPEWTAGPVPGSFFSAELFRNFSQLVDEWAASNPGLLEYFGGKSLVSQSHGQSFMAFFKAIYKVKGLHLLDEPETALSPQSQLALHDVLTRMGRAGHAQFIIATHSPILMSCPDAVAYSFDQIPLAPVDVRTTSHYRIYRDFFRAQDG